MMERAGFRRGALLWLLILAFVLGCVWHLVRTLSGHRAGLPVTMVRNEAEAKALKKWADSLAAARAAAQTAPINVNTATAAEFEALDGIGPVLAARIVAYREQHGPFSSVEELENVPGIGPRRLEALRRRCVLDSL